MGKIEKKLQKSDLHVYNFIKQQYFAIETGVDYENYKYIRKKLPFKLNFEKKDPKLKKLKEKKNKN